MSDNYVTANIKQESRENLFLIDCKNIIPGNFHDLIAAYLCSAETQIINRRNNLQAKQQYLASRYAIKTLIAQHSSLNYADLSIVFIKKTNLLTAFYQQQQLTYNICIAHSHSKVIIAINNCGIKSGVDIEKKKPNRNTLKLAEHFYHPKEQILIKDAGADAFYALWTLKEAYSKLSNKPLLSLLDKDIHAKLSDKFVFKRSFENYTLSVVSDSPNSELSITPFPIDALL